MTFASSELMLRITGNPASISLVMSASDIPGTSIVTESEVSSSQSSSTPGVQSKKSNPSPSSSPFPDVPSQFGPRSWIAKVASSSGVIQ